MLNKNPTQPLSALPFHPQDPSATPSAWHPFASDVPTALVRFKAWSHGSRRRAQQGASQAGGL
eukprot:scaffold7381_cov310-Pinguiococcus_pyrenoidosus.AAC.7